MKSVFWIPIWCVMMIPFFAMTTSAQNKNFLVKLRLAGQWHSYGFMITISDSLNQPHHGWEEGESRIFIDTSFTVSALDSIRFSNSIGFNNNYQLSFLIDSAPMNMRNFKVGGTTPWGNGYGTWNYTISLDTVRLSRTTGGFYLSPTIDRGSCEWAAYYIVQGHGGGETSGTDEEVDTVSLSIDTVLAGIGNEAKTTFSQALTVIQVNDREFHAFFPPFSSMRSLEILTVMGYPIRDIAIDRQSSSLVFATASLPPGLYFARLGDQVAKFIVPPR